MAERLDQMTGHLQAQFTSMIKFEAVSPFTDLARYALFMVDPAVCSRSSCDQADGLQETG